MSEPVPIIQLGVGEKVRVLYLLPGNKSQLHKLTVFGILPGVEIEILQRYPIYVLRVGHTQIALDDDIGKKIIVMK